MATVIIGSIVIGLMILAGYATYRRSKKGGCHGGCAGCSHSRQCNEISAKKGRH